MKTLPWPGNSDGPPEIAQQKVPWCCGGAFINATEFYTRLLWDADGFRRTKEKATEGAAAVLNGVMAGTIPEARRHAVFMTTSDEQTRENQFFQDYLGLAPVFSWKSKMGDYTLYFWVVTALDLNEFEVPPELYSGLRSKQRFYNFKKWFNKALNWRIRK